MPLRAYFFQQQTISSAPMATIFIDPEPVGAWRRMRRRLERVRDWSANENNPYSPLLCLSLLLAIGLIIEISR
jgi:hypothetical protein